MQLAANSDGALKNLISEKIRVVFGDGTSIILYMPRNRPHEEAL